ncbi:radical SAM/SPASM domain-containing protein [Thermogemmatispora sp.]|uniref:radical SAM/SPASM domain-containing protein n=1 Tax=Thermogemmatispora sp. TaxID=1968838 RepID=UPI001DD8A917|nr:radical SAM protein [Thermogemmatispora sp.]MBX5450020.1 radical SAM protein [Thermogemmatispora sp.]
MNVWVDLEPVWKNSPEAWTSDDCDESGECGLGDRAGLQAEERPLCYQEQSSLPESDLWPAGSARLYMPASLYWQECLPGHWLVCDPERLATFHLAVCDDETLALLRFFEQPASPAEAARAFSQVSAEALLSLLRLLIRLGLLLPVDGKPVRGFSRRQEGEGMALSAWLHITNACNLACQYCYVRKSAEHLPEETARRAVEAVFRSARRHGYQAVRLKYAGGEPTLRLRQVLALHDYALTLGEQARIRVSASLLTNGVALSERAIASLKERGIRVMLSLDGLGQQHDLQRPFVHGQGSFAYVERALKRLLAAGWPPAVNVTVSRRNLAGLPALLEYLLALDLPFTLSYYRENDCATNIEYLRFEEEEMIAGMRAAFAVIESRLPRRRLFNALLDRTHPGHASPYACGMGRHYLVIDQRGGVAPCHAALSQTVTDIAAEDPLEMVRRPAQGLRALPVDEKEGCRSCRWRYWCAGGCPLLTYRLTGRLDVRSPNCGIYQALFPDVLRLEALRVLKYGTPLVF